MSESCFKKLDQHLTENESNGNTGAGFQSFQDEVNAAGTEDLPDGNFFVMGWKKDVNERARRVLTIEV